MTYEQHGFNGATLSVVVRTAGDPNTLTETLQRLARAKSADVPMKFTTMESIVSKNVSAPRFRTLLLAVFAGLALSLALAGVYGVMAYAVGQRSKEIGVRTALRASRGSVIGLVQGQGTTLAAIGLGFGPWLEPLPAHVYSPRCCSRYGPQIRWSIWPLRSCLVWWHCLLPMSRLDAPPA